MSHSAALTISIFAIVVPVVISATIHLEAIYRAKSLAITKRLRGRMRLYSVFLILLFAHFLEILIFTMAFITIDKFGIGDYSGMAADPSFNDYVYFTVICYTTIGFGDILPGEYARLLTSVCALTGLILIAISATYLVFHIDDLFEEHDQKILGS